MTAIFRGKKKETKTKIIFTEKKKFFSTRQKTVGATHPRRPNRYEL
jgi:hypothetical protein